MRSRPRSSAICGRPRWPEVRAALDRLDAACGRADARRERAARRTQILYFADVCYVGQSYHLEIPLNTDAADPIGLLYRDFLAAHDRIYGHSTEGAGPHRQSAHASTAARSSAGCRDGGRRRAAGKAVRRARATRDILTAEAARSSPATSTIARRWRPGVEIRGPAIVEQPDTTTLIEPGWRRDGRRRRHPDHHRRADGTTDDHDTPGTDRIPRPDHRRSRSLQARRHRQRDAVDAAAQFLLADRQGRARRFGKPVHRRRHDALAILLDPDPSGDAHPGRRQGARDLSRSRRCATASIYILNDPYTAARICPISPSSCRSFIAARSSR